MNRPDPIGGPAPLLETDRLLLRPWRVAEAVIQRAPERSFFLRYEDFIADPANVVAGLLRLVGAEGAANPVQGRTVNLGKNHTVTGNPDRFRSGPTLLRPEDDAWRKERGR